MHDHTELHHNGLHHHGLHHHGLHHRGLHHHGPCHPLQCILPPHMVDAIKLRGTEKQRKMVAAIERTAAEAREARVHAAPPQAFMAVAAVAADAEPAPQREIFDANNRATLPGELVRAEGDPASDDDAVNEAYDGAGDTYQFFFEQFRRDSLDGHGLPLVSSVHVRRKFNNAFWNGEQMAYGDGDGIIFERLTKSLSVIGHELSHGVVQFSGGLVYQDQSGALNESLADVFGALTVQYKNGQTAAEADWLVGAEILGPDIDGVALRSLRAPGTAYDDNLLGKDPQPFHMDGFLVTSSDNGGVHMNSGIPNHAFYLLAQYLGGNAWEKAGHIWYGALQAINNPHATFAEWADKTVETSRDRFGSGSLEAILTRRSWKLVGISV
ncbi:MAG: M4 family metallopeptidase [Thermoanaerobaculia bacterium]